ncbi:hypothetical protein BDV93DRAFT_609057 [Ceratobasidium sp. AG-I]|nr:hypothetical protein BDV93DRAFT_609057 [Ceratobasidium sp. AG-I]
MPEIYLAQAYVFTAWALGPIPVSSFIDESLPHPGGCFFTPSPKNPFLNVPFERASRSQLHQSLISALNSRLTNFKCAAVSIDSSKPYIGLFKSRLEPSIALGKKSTPTNPETTELLIEVNRTKDDDPFCDLNSKFIDFAILDESNDLPEACRVKMETLG